MEPVKGGHLSNLPPQAKAVLDEALDIFPRDQWDVAYGSSGTVGAISDVLLANGRDTDTITRESLGWLKDKLIKAQTVDNLRLEGINTAQGNAKVLVELYRVAFDPLKEISFISDEYNKFELEGSLLADTTKPYDAVLGQFGRIVQL